ncbi:MAG: WXG100 family type VII secretion target [Phycisphaerales bacterium]
MAKAIADPAELRRFAQDLKRFNGELESQLGALHSRLSGLSQTWRDQEHAKFAEEFEHTIKVLGRFVEASNQHIPFLMRKAERLEDYLRQR